MVNSQCSAAVAPIYKYLKHSTFEKWASDNLLFIIFTLLYRDHPQRNCALSSPLNASLALQLLKRKPQENPRSYLAFQEAAKRAETICFRICCSKMARWDPALVRLKSSHRSWPMLKSTAKMELSVGIGLSLQLGRPC